MSPKDSDGPDQAAPICLDQAIDKTTFEIPSYRTNGVGAAGFRKLERAFRKPRLPNMQRDEVCSPQRLAVPVIDHTRCSASQSPFALAGHLEVPARDGNSELVLALLRRDQTDQNRRSQAPLSLAAQGALLFAVDVLLADMKLSPCSVITVVIQRRLIVLVPVGLAGYVSCDFVNRAEKCLLYAQPLNVTLATRPYHISYNLHHYFRSTSIQTEMNQPLTEKADRLQKKIKSLLPEAQERDPDQTQSIFYSKDKYGNTLYGGTSLGIAASEFVAAMELGEGWGWTVVVFSETRPIVNELGKIYLVPLSGDAAINPGGTLKEGSFRFIKDEPKLSSGAPVLFIAII
ncbi:hypothetical protein E8E15_002535 [Penicillium rubens]|nr:hypothetical protein E8E15_002535 [Penicillium rubens]